MMLCSLPLSELAFMKASISQSGSMPSSFSFLLSSSISSGIHNSFAFTLKPYPIEGSTCQGESAELEGNDQLNKGFMAPQKLTESGSLASCSKVQSLPHTQLWQVIIILQSETLSR